MFNISTQNVSLQIQKSRNENLSLVSFWEEIDKVAFEHDGAASLAEQIDVLTQEIRYLGR